MILRPTLAINIMWSGIILFVVVALCSNNFYDVTSWLMIGIASAYFFTSIAAYLRYRLAIALSIFISVFTLIFWGGSFLYAAVLIFLLGYDPAPTIFTMGGALGIFIFPAFTMCILYAYGFKELKTVMLKVA